MVAKALQTYGMVHADGGEIALTAAGDRYRTSTWDGLLGEDNLDALRGRGLQVIDHGAPIAYPYHCER